ncbi:hypothetical protein HNR00_003532 [Methylorubrum rhodinum]|uniref:Uncharacterized protein n=1 Tax=Methylorubrum rhodinum TaxID=29428 RepID=A0A840ZP44_9HYPH|nr:hypothetical protein [Methylorubrum rhodinum]
MIVALILYPAAIIAPAPTYRGHDACIAAGRAAATRGQARTWACVSVSVRSRANSHRDDRGGAL